MFLFLVIKVIVRGICLLVQLFMGLEDFPLIVFLFSCAVVIFGIVLIVLRIQNKLHTRSMTHFYIADTLVVIFNLIYMSAFSPIHINFVQFLYIGTLLDVVVNAVFLLAFNRKRKYVTIQTEKKNRQS